EPGSITSFLQDCCMTDQPRQPRQIDLGREDELVPWSAWFHRASHALRQFKQLPEGAAAVFRVTLIDGRVFAVTHVQTHVSRGKCMVGTDRFGESDPICDVVTGYTLVGSSGDRRPTALVVPPAMIASVECVAVDAAALQKAAEQAEKKAQDESEPFGFAAWRTWDGDLTVHEIDEVEAKGVGAQTP
ncbi:MAG: hypothetical protein AAGI30_12865, partial [Planctomycetota bacterium]